MANKFSFSYYPYPIKDKKSGKITGEILRPSIPVRMSYKKGQPGRPFQALVDSGSDRNLFPAAFGKLAGINIEAGIKTTIEGIGGHKMTAFAHKITIHVYSYSFNTEADFSYEQEMPLLGRNGFFNFFKRIDFKEKKRMIDFKY